VIDKDARYQTESDFSENQLDKVSEESDEDEKNMLELVLMDESKREDYEAEYKKKMYLKKKEKVRKMNNARHKAPCINICCK
jgi:hypothetical protein